MLTPRWFIGGRTLVRMTTHIAADDGQTCRLCGAVIAPAHHRYTPGRRVTVPFGDPKASWSTPRSADCRTTKPFPEERQ